MIKYNLSCPYKVDYFNYYRSETPFDINNMPAPTISNIIDIEFIDTDAEFYKEYYVIFGSIKNGIEYYSSIGIINTSLIDLNYKSKLVVTINFNLKDQGVLRYNWTSMGTVLYKENNTYEFGEGGRIFTDVNFDFNTNWSMEFDFIIKNSLTSQYPTFITNQQTGWASGGFQISYGASNASDASLKNKFFINIWGISGIISSINISLDTQYHVKVTKNSNSYTAYINDNLVLNGSISTSYLPAAGPLCIGSPDLIIKNFTLN